jgi:hypothetical protein
MIGDMLRHFQFAAVLQVGSDAGRRSRGRSGMCFGRDTNNIHLVYMKKAVLILTSLAGLTIAPYSQANKNDDDPVDCGGRAADRNRNELAGIRTVRDILVCPSIYPSRVAMPAQC